LDVGSGVALSEFRQCGLEPGRHAGAMYLDETGRSLPVALASHRVFVDRLLAALAERFHDAAGFTWPASIAPFDVHLITLGKGSEAVSEAAARLYARLDDAGLAVLLDDRDERAGVKFNDADLIGVPLRVVIGDRGLQTGIVEVKQRGQTEAQQLKLDELVDHARRCC
jgi:prolyl-tRNA synthetase